MKFAMMFANVVTFAGQPGLGDLAAAAEAGGFESVWTVEHVIYPDGYESTYPYDKSGKMLATPATPLPDPLIWLSFVAAATTTLRLGTGILILPQRNPVILAKEVATLDDLSGGRVELGVGVGWLKEEFEALGVPFERRGARADEYITVLRELWDADNAEHHGEFVEFSQASVNPKPVRGRVPIHIGGHSRAAAERAGRLGDGFFPAKGNLAELIDIMNEAAAGADRDPTRIEITFTDHRVWGPDPMAAVQELADLGVSRVAIPSFMFLADPADSIGAFGERVIAATKDVAPAGRA